jgi:hypothetical protein
MRAQALEELAAGAGARRQFSGAFAVGKEPRTIVVLHGGRPDAVDFIQQGGFVEPETARRQLHLHGFNSRFKGGIFAGDEAFGFHEKFQEGR